MNSEQKPPGYEAPPNRTVSIVVKDGRIQGVYVGPALAEADVEILDLDDAKVASNAEWHAVSRRVAEVKQQCLKIY